MLYFIDLQEVIEEVFLSLLLATKLIKVAFSCQLVTLNGVSVLFNEERERIKKINEGSICKYVI